MQQGRTSNCSLGVPLTYYWHDCSDPDGHLEAAVSALWEVVSSPTARRWNPYAAAMAKAEFRNRLKAAQRGELKPVDQVKAMDPDDELFEIRWVGLTVTEHDPDSGTNVFLDIEVRLLHAEPAALGVCAIGLHAHQKVVVDGDKVETRRLQDVEIAIAVGRMAMLAKAGWRPPLG